MPDQTLASTAPRPYKSTPVFDEDSLPAALRREHRTKDGVWGVIRVLSGHLRLHFRDSGIVYDLNGDRPGFIKPGETHWVEPLGPIRMQIDFYDQPPRL